MCVCVYADETAFSETLLFVAYCRVLEQLIIKFFLILEIEL